MMIVRTLILTGFTALFLATVPPFARAGSTYVFTNFSAPDSADTFAFGINNLGQVTVTGLSPFGGTTTDFVRNADGSFTTLTFNGSNDSNAAGINDSDQVVGSFANPSNNGLEQPFVAANGGNTLITLPFITSNTTYEVASGINDNGTIVGSYLVRSTLTEAGFVYANGSFTTLHPTSNAVDVLAFGINNNGLVVGSYDTNGGSNLHGFLYNTLTGTYTLFADPNVANLSSTEFTAINDNGLAAGFYVTTNGSDIGFIYNLATQTYTFLQDPAAATSGVSSTFIYGINDSGEVSGYYANPTNGASEGFVATASVPEPGSVALLGIGLTLAAGFARWRKRRYNSKSELVEEVTADGTRSFDFKLVSTPSPSRPRGRK
jgi:PEP-CTERM motif